MSGLSQIFNYLYCKCFPCSLKEKQQSICGNSKVYDGGRVQQIINGYQEWIFVSKKWILRVLQVCQVLFFLVVVVVVVVVVDGVGAVGVAVAVLLLLLLPLLEIVLHADGCSPRPN